MKLLSIALFIGSLFAADKPVDPSAPPTVEQLQQQVKDKDTQIAQLQQQIKALIADGLKAITTTSTNWSTAGTGLGVNACSGFSGNINCATFSVTTAAQAIQ